MSLSEPTETHEQDGEAFRDSLAIVTGEGKRNWIYPKQPEGRFTTVRTVVSWLLLVILFGVPFIRVDGHPFMLLNIVDRKFILFGGAFGPHDFYLLGLSMIAAIVFLFLFTAVFGRIFCGWICPQTVMLEMVFRKIDYWIEGSAADQRKLDAAPWTGPKIVRKLSKYAIYFVLSFLVANMMLTWVIGVEKLFTIMREPVQAHVTGFTAILIFTGVFYWIFIWFREQACILVCPYGRLQGVLMDRHTIVIAYDYLRGEPRGRMKRDTVRTEGDCIDCRQCVEVCPTGIDIRNGTQLECVNCTACIDTCDSIMDKVKKPRGLIRYDSLLGIRDKTGLKITVRVVGYSLVLLALVSVLTFLFLTRTPVDATMLRTPGMFFQEQADGRVSNLYDLKIRNKTFTAMPVVVRLESIPGEVKVLGVDLVVPPNDLAETRLFVILARTDLTAMNTPLTLGIYANGEKIASMSTSFLGPVKK